MDLMQPEDRFGMKDDEFEEMEKTLDESRGSTATICFFPSAGHEGGDPEVDSTRPHPSDLLDYFREKKEVIQTGDWGNM